MSRSTLSSFSLCLLWMASSAGPYTQATPQAQSVKHTLSAFSSSGLSSVSEVDQADILFLRGCFDSQDSLPPLIRLAHIYQRHSIWWAWLPKTLHTLQKKAEKAYAKHNSNKGKKQPIPAEHAFILQNFFAQHPPVTSEGREMYRRLVSGPTWIKACQRRLSTAPAEAFCALYQSSHVMLGKSAPPQLTSLLAHLNFVTVVPIKKMFASLARVKSPRPEHTLMAKLLGSVPSTHPLNEFHAYVATHSSSSNGWIQPLTVAAIMWCTRNKKSEKALDLLYSKNLTHIDKETYNKIVTIVKRELWQHGQLWETQGQKTKAIQWYNKALKISVRGSGEDTYHAHHINGMVSLFGLNQPKLACQYFLRSAASGVFSDIRSPHHSKHDKTSTKKTISHNLSRQDVRALFWLGVCAKRQGQQDLATRYWNKASSCSVFGYGQWALYMLNKPIAVTFPPVKMSRQGWNTPPLTFCQQLLDVWLHYSAASCKTMMYDTTYPLCLDIMALSHTPEACYYTLSMIQKIYPDYTTESNRILGKHAFGVFKKTYPTPSLSGWRPHKDDIGLLYSIIHTESSFRHLCIAHTIRESITGYMMIRKMTAQFIAQKNKIIFDEKRFKHDSSYHIYLGSLVLENLLQRTNRSYTLTATAYNGGMASVHRWKKEIPRQSDRLLNTLHWIESIPFTETRQYVMTVLEAYAIYRTLLGKPMSTKQWFQLTKIHPGG